MPARSSKSDSVSRRRWPCRRGFRAPCCPRRGISCKVERATSWGAHATNSSSAPPDRSGRPTGSTSFTGSGLRIRRQGVRHLTEFRGHCWQSALFPSGRAFGYIAYPPREDGRPTFNEGYVFDGDGDLVPARVLEAPWLTRLQALGQDVSLVLETENSGRTH